MNKKIKFKFHSCDICDEDNPIEIELSDTDGEPIHVCSNCGFVYVR